MREIRSSGSVEGVISDGHSYSDSVPGLSLIRTGTKSAGQTTSCRPWPFGALHVRGFPRGWAGVGLATIYGVMTGGIRRRSGGMLAPWVAHVFTDIVIAGIVVMVARPTMALHPSAVVDLSLNGRG